MSSTSAAVALKLAGLRPVLVTRISLVLAEMEANDTPMRITDGFRSTAQQVSLYRRGRFGDTRPIVTSNDGIHLPSKHQSGSAVDCCFLGTNPYSESHPWGLYGARVRAAGLKWGGDFHDAHGKPKPDRPHAELAEDGA